MNGFGKNIKGLLILSFVLLMFPGLQAKDPPRLTVMFYNTENLFDTVDDPATEDDAFTPAGEKKWTRERYEKKLEDLAKAIAEVLPKGTPALIGLSEVENRQVVEDLAHTGKLKKRDYQVVHEESPDKRGIDVALLYDPARFRYLSHRSVRITFPRNDTKVRDILYVKGRADGELLHLFVNHWKSRSGGVRATEQMRVYSAVVLRRMVDSILNFEPQAKIILMGDFNDEPTNMSLMQILQAADKRKNISRRDLYNLMYDAHNLRDTGTYSYKGSWLMLDQIIVSYPLLQDKEGWHTDYHGGHIFSQEWMLYDNPKAGCPVPNRTYGGPNFFGGISDHLPVYCTFEKPTLTQTKKKRRRRRR